MAMVATIVQTSAWNNPRCVFYEGLRISSRTSPSPPQTPGRNAARAGTVLRVAASGAKMPLFSFQGENTGFVVLDLKVASAHTAKGLVHRGVVTELRNKRQGNASTKTRGEVRGGGRKPYQQKGSGRARRGSQRTPLRPGGGIIHGPKPRDWKIKMNKKEKRLAISTALQSAVVDSIAVEDFEEEFTLPKTKNFLAAMDRWKVDDEKHSLFFLTNLNDHLLRSSRNLQKVKLMTPRTLNIYDVLRADKLVFTKSGIDYLNGRYGANPDALLDDEDDEDEEDEDFEDDEEGDEEGDEENVEENAGEDEEQGGEETTEENS